MSRKKTTSKSPDEEVEELLKATQDDVLLKLTINSHMAHSSSQNFTINPDLDTRFQALKSKKSKLPKTSAIKATDAEKKKKKNPEIVVNEVDDIFTRFSALKNKSLPSASSAGGGGVHNNQLPDNDDSDEEDEVEKVIKWARDAARLDPSPPSDTEDDASDTEEESDEEIVASNSSRRR